MIATQSNNYYVTGMDGWHSPWTTQESAWAIARHLVESWQDAGLTVRARIYYSNGTLVANVDPKCRHCGGIGCHVCHGEGVAS